MHERNPLTGTIEVTMETIAIEVSQPYQVIIGRGLLNQARDHLANYIKQRKVLIVTDENIVANQYLSRLVDNIEPIVNQVESYIIPAGESQKNFRNVEDIIAYLADQHFSREDIIIALGGGVIGDLVGFTASIYLRGINYIQIPTTFLSAIDSSVGGKTAIDITQGKNMVGAFYHPKIVLCDVESFNTLPSHIFEDGCSELIKYAMIMNPKLLTYLIEREDALEPTDKDIEAIVGACVRMKKEVVLEDEFDKGRRQLLNFGHTLGHAIEQLSGYTISHGRSVAIGMKYFTQIAFSQGVTSDDFSHQLEKLLNQYHLLSAKVNFAAEDLLMTMLNDKKRRRDKITLVLPKKYGHCELVEININLFEEWFNKEWESNEAH